MLVVLDKARLRQFRSGLRYAPATWPFLKGVFMRRFLQVASVLALLVSLQFRASAQATATATLQGTVFDSSQATLPKASLQLVNEANGLSREGESSDSGNYIFNNLPAGIYTLTVKAPGFKTAVYDKITLQVATSTTINPTVQPGDQSSVVNVQDAAPLVDTTRTDVSRAITPTEVQTLPLNSRDFANLAFLAPGAKPVNSYDPTKNRIAVFGINGSNGRNVNITVNGIDNKDNTVGGPVMQLPLEAVQEFNISTQRFSAANGRSEGAAVNVITKSGTNQFHGSLYLFARDTALNANDYFSKQADLPTSPYSRQQYGGSIGGPVKKDKLFLFFSLERLREQQQISVGADAFQQLTLAAPLGAVPVRTIDTPFNDQRYTGRLDWTISPVHQFSVTYNSQSNNSSNDQSTALVDATAGNTTINDLILTNATLNSVISPRIVNSFTFGYQYWHNLIDSDTRAPYVTFPSGAAFGTNPNVPQESYQAKWQFRDDISFNRDKHTFRAGADFVNVPKLGGTFGNTVLNYTFLADATAITGNRSLYPQGFATPGLLGAITASAGDPRFATVDGKMLGLYFQDDYKITSRFNLSLGIRWDKDFNLNGGNVQSRSLTYQYLRRIGSPFAGGLPINSNRNFSPRVGFAYDITGTGKHVVRGGYGIYFGQTFQNIPLFMQQQANALIYTGTLNLSSSGPGDNTAGIVPGTNVRLSSYRYGVDPAPIVPQPLAGLLPQGSTGRLVDPNYQNPYNQEFNLAYSWQISQNDLIEVEGIHTLALRESKRVNINPTLSSGIKPLDASFNAAGLPRLAQIIVESSVGRSRYDALNISYRRRLSNHFSVNTNYVRSRALAYNGGPAQFGNISPDPNNLFGKSELGPAPNDEPHRWVFSGLYQGPWGIQLAPIIQWATGRPYTPTQGINVFANGNGNGAWRAIVPADNQTNYRATAAFTAAQLRAGLANGSLVTLPFDPIRGNRFFQFDLRVSKFFTFAERHRLELLCQMFNLTNRANFGTQYNTSIRSATFGQPNNYLSISGSIVPHAFVAEFGFQYRF